jgi:hypothetical protein
MARKSGDSIKDPNRGILVVGITGIAMGAYDLEISKIELPTLITRRNFQIRMMYRYPVEVLICIFIALLFLVVAMVVAY